MFLPKDLRYFSPPTFTVAANTIETFIIDIPSTARTLYSIARFAEIAGDARFTFSIDNEVIAQNVDQDFLDRQNIITYPTQPAPGRLFAHKCNPSSEYKLTIDNRSVGQRTFNFLFTFLEYQINVSPRRAVGFDRDASIGTNNYKFQLPSVCDKLISYNIGEKQFSVGDALTLTVDNQVLIQSVSPDYFVFNFVQPAGDYCGYLNYPVSKNSNFFISLTNTAGVLDLNHIFYYK